MSGLIVKTFAVAADGFPAMNWTAKSRSKALALAWDSYRSYRDIAFKEFLRIARSWRVANPDGFGRSITVCGEPAFWISQNSQYVRFVRLDSDVVLNAHPSDVTFDGDLPDA